MNGYWMIFRLTVDDYHRYSFIDDGKIIEINILKVDFIQLILLLMIIIRFISRIVAAIR